MLEHAVGLGERTARGHDVVEDEPAFVHLRQQIGAEIPVAEVRPRSPAADSASPSQQRLGQSPFEHAVMHLAARGPSQAAGGVLLVLAAVRRWRSRNSTRLRPGVHVSASISDVSSAAAMVMASARKKLPVTPVTAISGRKTTTGVMVEPIERDGDFAAVPCARRWRAARRCRDASRCFQPRR